MSPRCLDTLYLTDWKLQAGGKMDRGRLHQSLLLVCVGEKKIPSTGCFLGRKSGKSVSERDCVPGTIYIQGLGVYDYRFMKSSIESSLNVLP